MGQEGWGGQQPLAWGFRLPALSRVFRVRCVQSSSLRRCVLYGGQREGWSGGFALSLGLNSMGTEFRFFAAV